MFAEDPRSAAAPPGWLTIKEASGAYGVSVHKIRHWVVEETVPVYRAATPTGWIWRVRPPESSPPRESPPVLGLLDAARAEIADLRARLARCEARHAGAL